MVRLPHLKSSSLGRGWWEYTVLSFHWAIKQRSGLPAPALASVAAPMCRDMALQRIAFLPLTLVQLCDGAVGLRVFGTLNWP